VPALADGSQVETVRFTDPRWPAVKIVRGAASSGAPPAAAVPQFRKTAANTEIVSFGDGSGQTVAVVRGSGIEGAGGAQRQARLETVRFADPPAPPVNILRGRLSTGLDISLFGAANGGELDRVAFAVDGVESGHGSNLAMWRD